MNSTSILILIASMALTFSYKTASAHDEHDETSGHHFVPKTKSPSTAPATNFQGRTPIDRGNGIFFNSGTYGARNPEYEQWASGATWAVSLGDRSYSYEQKERFIATLDERIRHFELAVWNYGRVTDTVSKPEGKAHAEKAIADLNPRIEKAREAWSKAKSAGPSDWENEQGNAKKAFIDLQSFYYGMHNNVH